MAVRALARELPAVEERPVMPRGFRAGATIAGIKASGRPDLGILAVDGEAPASVAATFTTNLVLAAPVRLSQAHLGEGGGRFGRTRAVISTSGCANAATGPAGDADQHELAAALSAALGLEPELTLSISTGLIGTRLPVQRIRAALPGLVERLEPTEAGLAALGEQMMTTDSRAKSATVRLELPDTGGRPVPVTVSGVAKGVGMIHPRMATMLALVLTDAEVEPPTLHALLQAAVEPTWNQLTVDGDTSTNDTVFLLASGASGCAPVAAGSAAADTLGRAVMAVARSLARQQAADGEGATTLVTCQVSGARDDGEARAVARSIVASSLVKAAVHGRDPNWGRIAAAAGNARLDGRQVSLDVERLRIELCGTLVFAGQPIDFEPAAVSARMAEPEVLVWLDLGLGEGWGEAFGCDLTEEYVVENSAYST
ncbi:MAG TPA: bifunctional glutamate N-acetyltransferase/amino-acid acetyltransferase ArgJ [Candidatus Limnocylindria bacterium]|nr:bifunctional glutamate N-acetyltransferase/amino-acid acetyltransferase ArgJ [Candidatus Limnocylindria bacterium]